MNRDKLKGGIATRRGGRVYDQYDNITKSCGCKMGKCKCEKPCKPLKENDIVS